MIQRLLPVGLGLLLTSTALVAADGVTTVTYAKTHGSYRHAPAKTETYVLSEGSARALTAPDAALQAVSFQDLSEALAETLSGQGFRPATHSNDASLLLVVHRGLTHPRTGEQEMLSPGTPPAGVMTPAPSNTLFTSGGSAAGEVEQRSSSSANRTQSALVLGYADEYRRLSSADRAGGTENLFEDLLQELDEPRYFVVVAAYDNRILRGSGRRVLLWETRLSFRADSIPFDQAYAAAIAANAKAFGSTTARLDRRYVQLGDDNSPDARRLADARF